MRALPLDTADTELGARILKVNHAGENGAVQIYAAQIAVARLTAPALVAELREFRSHEERHRAIFQAELLRRGRPRCRSYVLCALGGWVLGFVTGLLGSSAIAATTVAVERVVLRHLKVQLAQLRHSDPAAVLAIEAIVADEQRHHDELAAQVGQSAWVKVLEPVVSTATEAVIWLGMKL
ncbi:demethoxyubiquinone hydroxylase family protein [Roseateles sp.]|uniref:demethoxyubiquinone hydroxylase family protein n=1 Tax=Roseateles sp. TaxID=1971397 RepID=UPI0039E9E35C